MDDPSPNPWQRTYWNAGGADADLYFVVYGDFPREIRPSRSRHRVTEVPPSLTNKLIRKDSDPTHQLLLCASFGQPLEEVGDGPLERALATPVASVLRARIPDPSDLSYLRSVVGIVESVFEAGGVAVLDMHALRLWDRAHWHDHVFLPEAIPLDAHVNTQVSQRDGWGWIHTRGLAKFGRPDVGIYKVPPHENEPATNAARRIAAYLAAGGRLRDGEAIHIPGTVEPMRAHVTGRRTDPDYDNLHVHLDWSPLTGHFEAGDD